MLFILKSLGKIFLLPAVELTDLMSTLERLNATEMMKALQMSGLARLLNQENYTVFAPVDDAFDKYKAEVNIQALMIINIIATSNVC